MTERWKSIDPQELKEVLKNFKSPWWFAGGHALDLWIGKKTRDHGDIDITLFRKSFNDLYSLDSNLEFYVANKNGLKQLKNILDLQNEDWNIWVKNIGEDEWLFQCLIVDEQFGEWQYRRNREIACPKEEFGLSLENDIMVINPKIQLLFKSKSSEEKDEMDFQSSKKYLTKSQKKWLKESLLKTYPSHPWIDQL